jgi:nitrate/TMAO reductase-like tetraheme cytochrome c subunit
MPTRYGLMTPAQKSKANERNKRWKSKNKESVSARKRAHYQANRQKYLTLERDRQYRIRYGITLEDYNRLLESQSGKCRICESPKAGNKDQHFAVDHCHHTGRVRGLLCIKCNARLGWFEKNRESTLRYLLET